MTPFGKQRGQFARCLPIRWLKSLKEEPVENRHAIVCMGILRQVSRLPEFEGLCEQLRIASGEFVRTIDRVVIDQTGNQSIGRALWRTRTVRKNDRLDDDPAVVLVRNFDVSPLTQELRGILRVPGCPRVVGNAKRKVSVEGVADDLESVDDQIQLPRLQRAGARPAGMMS